MTDETVVAPAANDNPTPSVDEHVGLDATHPHESFLAHLKDKLVKEIGIAEADVEKFIAEIKAKA